MTRIVLKFFCAAAILTLAGCAGRHAKAPPPPLILQEEQLNAVTAELKRSVAGWNAGDLDTFLAVYADNASFARQDSFIRGKAAIRAMYAPAFAPGLVRDSLVLARLEMEMISQDTLLIKGLYQNTREGTVTRRGTTSLLVRLINGQWRIIHDHSS